MQEGHVQQPFPGLLLSVVPECSSSAIDSCLSQTAEAERSFSVLRRLKTYARSTMAEERLAGLSVSATHYKAGTSIRSLYEIIYEDCSYRLCLKET